MKSSHLFRAVLAVALVGGGVHGASAVTVYSKTGNTSRNTERMFTDACRPTDPTYFYYEDHLPPNQTNDYIVSNLMGPDYVANSTTNHVFQGKSCQISHFSMYAYAPNQMTFPNDGLILAADCDMRERWQYTRSYIINGKVRVDGTSGNPSKIRKTSVADTKGYRATYLFTGAFSSLNANSYLRLPAYGSLPGELDMQLGGDVSGFAGTIWIDPEYGTNWLSFVGASQTFPGTVRLTRNAELRVSGSTTSLANVKVEANTSVLEIAVTNALTVGKLTMASGLTLPVKTTWLPRSAGHLTVTDGSALAGTLSLDVTVPSVTSTMLTNSTGRCALLTVPVAYDNYTVNYPENVYEDFHGSAVPFSLVTETNDTTKTVYLTHPRKHEFALGAFDEATLPAADLGAGAICYASAMWGPTNCGHLVVSGETAPAGRVEFTVAFPTFTKDNLTNSMGRAAVLTVPVAYENYSVTYPDVPVRDYYGTLPEFTLVTETNGTAKTLYLAHRKIIVNVKSFEEMQDLLTNGEYWSDGEPLTNSAAIYWFGNNLGTRFTRFQPSYTNAFKDISFVSPYGFTLGGSLFQAKRLQLVAGSSSPLYVTFFGQANTVRDLVGGKSYGFNDVSTFIAESIELVSQSSDRSISIQSYDGHFLNFRGAMSGNSDIKFKARGVNIHGKAALGGYIYFENGMTNFTGKMISAKVDDFTDWADRTWDYGSAWVVSKTSNLGAPRASFTYDAISLRYLNSIYTLSEGNVTLDELTRGIYVAGGTADNAIGFIVTPGGRTLTVKQALRMNGTLKKVGAGTLVLSQNEAQKLTFGSDAIGSDTPTTGANVFKMQAGALKVTTKFAADGFALSFTNGTSLVVTPGATVETNSLYNVKGTVASACTGDLAGKIPVAFDTTGVSDGQELAGVLCTVASSSALTTNSFVMTTAKPFNTPTQYVLTVSETTDGSGNKVFTATARPYGTFLFFR